MKTKILFFIFLFLGPLSIVHSPWSSSLHAGQPWFVDILDNSGTPARWPYNATTKKWVLHWKMDPGSVNVQGRPVAVGDFVNNYIKPMLDDWQNVTIPTRAGESLIQTAALQIIYDGPLSSVTDIDQSNYRPYALNPDEAHPPPTVVIFDADGSIIQDYCVQTGGSAADCDLARNRIVGMGRPFLDSTSKLIRHGFIFLNGRMINGVDDAGDKEVTIDQFKAVIKHEFGHLLNLDHSQVNAVIAEACSADDCDGAEGIGTMFPSLKTTEQYSLHRDDKVSISWLYPTDDFRNKFCVITGEIQDGDGKGMQGVNVIAKNVNDPEVDARSMVSGALYSAGTADGHYYLSGIVPGQSYQIIYEELLDGYNQQRGSEFGPLGADSPKGFGTGDISGPDGSDTVKCDEGGGVIEIPAFKMGQGTPAEASAAVEQGSEKKGWLCQLGRTGGGTMDYRLWTMDLGIWGIFSLGLILLMVRLNYRRGA